MPSKSSSSSSSNKRLCSDQRSVVVGTEVAGFVEYVNRVTSERDALKARCEALESDKIAANEKAETLQATFEELQETVSSNEENVERFQRDATYYEDAFKKTKLERDDFEMRCRVLNEKTSILALSVDKCKRDYENCQEYLNTKDAEIGNLQVNFSRVKHELIQCKDKVLQQKRYSDNCDSELEAEKKKVSDLKKENKHQKKSAVDADVEVSRYQTLATETRTRLENLEASSSIETSALKSRVASLELAAVESERMTRVVGDKNIEIESFFNDAYTSDNQGTGVLLTSGKMLSFETIARLWIGANGFDGNPNYSIECHASRTMASVIHSPAVCSFVSNIATNTSFNPNPFFYFKYSEQPVAAATTTTTDGPVVVPSWKVYNQYDQLALIAKMIFMYKSNENTSSFQSVLSQNHIVTAVCSKNGLNATVNISLTVMSRTGAPSTHHIEFVDPVNLEFDDEKTLFPSRFSITNNTATTAI